LRFGSLFSGIGGLDRAVEARGLSPAWQVENDEFCRKVLERHWPDVRRYGDIREIDWRSVERVGLICSGFPCQPFSVAGQN
jgi:DNA (cytosine-5)-methyltransferase 1